MHASLSTKSGRYNMVKKLEVMEGRYKERANTLNSHLQKNVQEIMNIYCEIVKDLNSFIDFKNIHEFCALTELVSNLSKYSISDKH